VTIHVYAVCHNEEALLPYFLRHYGAFADRIVVFDGASTDRSREILRAHPKVRLVDSSERPSHDEGMYDEPTLMKIRNRAYRDSRGEADWVMVVDIDEFIHHPDIVELLKRYSREGITLPGIVGFEMVSEDPPTGTGRIQDEIRTGFLNRRYSKQAVFDPRVEINFEYGCHECFPEGPVKKSPEAEIKLLHYRFLGERHFADKYMLRQRRMSPESRIMKWGTHLAVPIAAGAGPLYPATEESLRARYREIVSSTKLVDAISVSESPKPRLSIPLSVHNRAALLRRAIDTYMQQTLPPQDWEVILVDDASTEDLGDAYRHLLGKINLRHVRFDHKLHPLWKARNPDWRPGDREDWWKTPALTTNLGCSLARAPFVGLFHPEVMHAPRNFERAVAALSERACYLFGKVWLGDKAVNAWLDATSDWKALGWEGMMDVSGARACRAFKDDERYWYCSFLPKAAVERIRGVDLEYLKGNSYEDCDFKERVNRAGWPDLLDPSIEGLHQDHSGEREPHRIRDARWIESEVVNGQLFRTRLYRDGFPDPVNADVDWIAQGCIVRVVDYRVGLAEPWSVRERAPSTL